jgi:hypothetical protein
LSDQRPHRVGVEYAALDELEARVIERAPQIFNLSGA